YTLTVASPAEWVSLGTLLFTGIVTGQLSALAKRREESAIASEQAAALLYRIARAMGSPSIERGLKETTEAILASVQAEAVTITASVAGRRLEVASGSEGAIARVRGTGRFGSGRILSEVPDSNGFRPGRWIRTRSGFRTGGGAPYDLYHVRVGA